MANRKLRVTGFTRFLLFLLFVAPLAYIGASYYNGEDGIQKVKEFINKNRGNTTEQVEAKTQEPATSNTAGLKDCQAEIEKLENRLERKEREIDELYKKVEQWKAKAKN